MRAMNLSWTSLASRPVIEELDHSGETTALSPRVGDAKWDLSAFVFRENAMRSESSLSFSNLTDIQAGLAKSYLYARLNHASSRTGRKLGPDQLGNTGYAIFAFVRFITEKYQCISYVDVSPIMIEEFLKYEKNVSKRTHAGMDRITRELTQLYNYRDVIPGGGLRFDPFGNRLIKRTAGRPPIGGENRTDRIPEPVIGILFKVALRYVTSYCHDILDARKAHNALIKGSAEVVAREAHLPRKKRMAMYRGRLAHLLRKWAKEGLGVPVWGQPVQQRNVKNRSESPIQYVYIKQLLGAPKGENIVADQAMSSGLRSHIEKYGYCVGTIAAIHKALDSNGRPWRQSFDTYALKCEERYLMTACYIICAYLTGMRDSEIQSMKSGCIEGKLSAERGRIVVNATAYKNRGVRGTREQWVTIWPVAEAVSVLMSLQKAVGVESPNGNLWMQLWRISGTPRDYVGPKIVTSINDFWSKACSREEDFGRLSSSHKDWRFTTRQFRRTIAWFIANRPFGTIAGNIQFKHASVAIFEGYAGSSRSGFAQEVEAERQLGQLDDLLTYFRDVEIGQVLSGPAARRVTAAMEDISSHMTDFGGVIATDERVKLMLRDQSINLYIGRLNDCFFEASTALCLQSGNLQEERPHLDMCSPDRCPNSCLRAQHREVWRQFEKDIDRRLKERGLSKLQRQLLRSERGRIKKMVVG